MTHTVLLVEEDVESLRSMARMLVSEPYGVYTVRSAAEAVRLMKFRAVDAIVAGDGLSVMSAVDLFAWVAGKNPEAVCVLLAGEGSMESVIRAVNDGGAFQIVARPCDAVQLAGAIRKALAHGDWLRTQLRLRATAGELESDRRRFAGELETASPGDRPRRGEAAAVDRRIVPGAAREAFRPVRFEGEDAPPGDARGGGRHAMSAWRPCGTNPRAAVDQPCRGAACRARRAACRVCVRECGDATVRAYAG